MKQYDYDFCTNADLDIEAGTQQLPVLVRYLVNAGKHGWHVVHFEGEFEGHFIALLEREVQDAP